MYFDNVEINDRVYLYTKSMWGTVVEIYNRDSSARNIIVELDEGVRSGETGEVQNRFMFDFEGRDIFGGGQILFYEKPKVYSRDPDDIKPKPLVLDIELRKLELATASDVEWGLIKYDIYENKRCKYYSDAVVYADKYNKKEIQEHLKFIKTYFTQPIGIIPFKNDGKFIQFIDTLRERDVPYSVFIKEYIKYYIELVDKEILPIKPIGE